MLLNVLFEDISSREGLERGDRDIGDPLDEEVDMDDIPEDATDVFRDDSLRYKEDYKCYSEKMNKYDVWLYWKIYWGYYVYQLFIPLFIKGIIEKGPH